MGHKPTGIEKLKTGDFNSMAQEELDDGSVLVTLTSRKYPEIYRFRVKDLYGENEEVLEEKIVGGDEE